MLVIEVLLEEEIGSILAVAMKMRQLSLVNNMECSKLLQTMLNLTVLQSVNL